MTKKEKRKKLQPEKTDLEVKDVEKETPKTEGKSKSRSRSRGRRSLSAIFRKSSSRTESNDRSNLLINEEAGQESASDINPRINPRDYLKRMTVREALVYDRHRGRSPSRRTRKLEKKILHNEARLSNDNLSVSLPHLDHLSEDQSHEPAASFVSYDARGGSTLPRIKKRRGHSDGRDAQQSDFQSSNISNISKPVQILPLDKRKYLINKDIYIDETNIPQNINLGVTNDTHSNKNDNRIPDELSENEKRRLETHNMFLSLRDNKSAHTHSHLALEQVSDDFIDGKPDTTALTILHTTSANSNVEMSDKLNKKRTVESCQVDNNHTYQNDISRECGSPKNVNADCADIEAPVFETQANKTEKKRRSSYISPRRFSRTSRASVTSNISDSSNRSLPADYKPQYSTEPQKAQVKYQRHFSKENKKDKQIIEDRNEKQNHHQQMIDASTSMDRLSLFAETDNHQNHNIKLKKIVPDVIYEPEDTTIEAQIDKNMCQSLAHENEILKNNSSALECIEDKCENLNKVQSLQREIIVIDTNVEQNIQTHDHESAFRPIRSDTDLYVQDTTNSDSNKGNKCHHIGFDIGEIEVLSSDIVIENEKHVDSSFIINHKAKKDVKKSKDESEDIKKVTEKDTEKTEKDSRKSWSGKSKKEKRKSKKKLEKEKHRKESGSSSKTIECVENENVPTHGDLDKTIKDDGKSKCSKSKKRKSILKRRSKENKSLKDSIKPITRTASLSQFVDECEGKERRKSVSICEKRSRSMDDLTKGIEILDKDKAIVKHNVSKKTDKPAETKCSNNTDLKDVKPPRLSIAAIVAIRAKISRMKRARQEHARNNACNGNNDSESKVEDSTPHNDHHESNENTDMSVAKVFYENEINTSLGKSDNSISLIEDADKEVKDLVYDKRISFSPYCDDTISEEEMIKQRQRNTRLTSRRESKVRQRQKKVINCCKKGIAFLFSHIGLCSLVVGYCILGGIIFKALEGDNEIEQKKEIKELRQNFTEKIYRLAFEQTLTKGNRDIFMNEVNLILKNFSVMIHKQTKEAGWDGKEVKMTMNTDGEESMEPEPEQWSYPSSLLYAITVMTTIGYGHVAPKTDEGRIMTIAYAVLGIPLTLLCLTNIGDLMAHGFRSLYGKVCCGLCCILFRPRRRRRMDPEKGLSGAEERMIMQENEKSGEVVHVPTSVCLLLMSSYIMLGTLLFAEWENWDMVTGTYFCFITLSTIGFGDVVPGMNQTDWDQQEKLVSCALYLVFGLSLIAMCFNLVQEDVKAKCKWLGMKLGIIDKPVSSV
ncbi:E3 ubiquitin-protein ligase RBBP6-like [Ruditapes philippinarum]|uniref:E3 ubiquitin-protein ligase RBBP6-like n=1 Tax=Ruditapes philippinarum TaxID=129788 RepID=UPI00295BF499|nr:E3 ubiquitin-protein ligase RBBP6-like [Ruditapes philippinarum]XP_060571985.1 E3 ubiquitin-protein ligase RBBP6-like [Ruditapes philippinarum]